MCATNNKGKLYEDLPDGVQSGANLAAALTEFIDDDGVPDTLVCDLATEQTGKNSLVMKLICRFNIKMRLAVKGRGTTQNHQAETEIREVKAKWKTRMQSSQVPPCLGDYGLVYIAEIQTLLARVVDQRPGIERVTGNTIDISEWLDFDFFDRVWYWDQKKMDMTGAQARLGQWLGIFHRVGSDMAYWIFTEPGKVFACSTVQHTTVSNMATDEMTTRTQSLDANLTEQLAGDNFTVNLPNDVFYIQDEVGEDASTPSAHIPPDAEHGDMLENDKAMLTIGN